MAVLPVPALIRRKRDGASLDASDWRAIALAYARDELPDYQMAALAMAVFFRGMTEEETAALTLGMRDSGHVIARGTFDRPAVDKHSTGGVGDKVSIALAPLAAATGLAVPMITGRGLGHTGGTADKLESIPGYRVRLEEDELVRIVRRVGAVMAAQSETLAPADKRLYALRDVTATVESVPLITASILSKKLAEGLDALVMDVKVGRAAFMRTHDDARALAQSLVRVGAAAGTPVSALLTRMDGPLGRTIGNALEVREAVALLEGDAAPDLLACTRDLAIEMNHAAGVDRVEAARRVDVALSTGRAREVLDAIVQAQGGDPRALANRCAGLPKAPEETVILAEGEGTLGTPEGLELALVSMDLGAGRNRAEDAIDPRVGIELHVSPGDRVLRGQPLATVHASRPVDPSVQERVRRAFTFANRDTVQEQVTIERLASL